MTSAKTEGLHECSSQDGGGRSSLRRRQYWRSHDSSLIKEESPGVDGALMGTCGSHINTLIQKGGQTLGQGVFRFKRSV